MCGGFLAVGDPYLAVDDPFLAIDVPFLAIDVPFLVAGVPFHFGLAQILSIGHSVASDEGAVLPSRDFEEE